MARYYIQFILNGVTRIKYFKNPQEAARYGYNISSVPGVSEVSGVVEIA